MFDDELETDELDTGDDSDVDTDDLDIDDVDDDVDDDLTEDSVDDGSDAVVTPSRAKAKTATISSMDDLPSVEAKQKERDALAKAMEEFLARGGKVQEVENKIDV